MDRLRTGTTCTPLCRVAVVVLQQPTEPFATPQRALTRSALAGQGKEQYVALALMIPLVMNMRHVLRQRMTERRFPTQDQPREALLLDRPDPALRIGVQIRRPWWQRDPRDPGGINDLLKGRT